MTILNRSRFTKKDFAWTSWTPDDLARVADAAIARKKERYVAIRTIPAGDRTFENTIIAIERSDDDVSDDFAKIGLLQVVSPNKAVRDAAAKVAEQAQKRLVDIEFDPRMYKAAKEYAAKRQKLTGADKRLFEDLMKGYARMGFDLPVAKQKKLKGNLKFLGKLGIAFDRNLNEYKDHILVTDTELDGLPETYKQNLERVGKRYKVTLAYPDAHPYLAGAHDETRRRELFEKFVRKGGPENIAILKKMFALRAETARMLGYKTYADFQTELRMAKSAARVNTFLTDLEKRTRAQAKTDLAMLTADKRRRTGNKKAKVESHDVGYLFKQLRKEKFDIDGDLVKEYFPFEHVKQATLDAYQTLLGVRFKRRNDIPLWDADVQLYDIHDPKDGYLSSFALDLYPREGKYGHAAAFDIIYGRQLDIHTYQPPLVAMVTNFPKPTSTNPSLMSHGEVETFFHEFGHVMHFTLTKAKHRAQSGFSTAWDFVEAPSQMLENWVWDPDMLKKLSKHYKTGRPLPGDLIERMIEARLFGEAWSIRGQVALAMLDMTLHTKKIADPNALYPKLQKKFLGITPPKKQLYLAGFGHLAHGYDAGYYGYLWSKVYAEDMFTRFAKEGILNPKTGHDYRTWILEKGSSEDEANIVKGFLGRKPNNKAFLRAIGV